MWREVILGLSVENLGVECGERLPWGLVWKQVTLGLSVERGYLGVECGERLPWG